MICGIPHRRPVCHLPFRVDDIVCSVAQQKFGMDVPGCPRQHEGCAMLFQQRGGLQGALEIIADGDDAQVKVPDAQGCDELFIGAVPDLCIGYQRKNVIDPILVAVHSQHLVVQLLQLFRHVAAKTPQANQKNRFHMDTPFNLPLPVLAGIERKRPDCWP